MKVVVVVCVLYRKILQCDMAPHQLKLQSAALAAIVKISLVEKSFDPATPLGQGLIDQVLTLLERLHTVSNVETGQVQTKGIDVFVFRYGFSH
jgi:hypothetical protein